LINITLNLHSLTPRFIHSTNRAGKSYKVAVNHLADRLDHELKALRGFRVTPGHVGGLPFSYTSKDLKDLPDYVDWRLYGEHRGEGGLGE
jgi:hypothetical protein